MISKEALCPQCGAALTKVRNPAGSSLNDDQFDAVKAGDWYCASCPSNDRGNSSHCYWNDSEVKFAIKEGTFAVIPVGDEVRVCQITAEDTEEKDTEIVRFPEGDASKITHGEMVLLDLLEPAEEAMEFLFKTVEKYSDRLTANFGALKEMCRAIYKSDPTAPAFFAEHDRRVTSDAEMAKEILAWFSSKKS